jgi:N-acetylneuraminic acid mutarotase
LGGWHYNNKLYFFGGYGTPPEVASGHQYAIEAGWKYLRSDSSKFIHDHNSTSWNNQLISFDLETKTWELHTLVGNAPSARAAHTVVFVPETSKVIVFGGRLVQQRMNDLYILDLPSMVWTKIETNEGPCGRSWHSLVALDSNRLLLFGGFSQNAVPLDDCWYFDLDKHQWTELKRESAKKPRLWHTAVAINRSCYIFGGCRSNILAIGTVREFANDLHVIEAAPRSLSERCFKFMTEKRRHHASRIAQLPGPLYEKLHFISSARRQKSMRTPIDLLKV